MRKIDFLLLGLGLTDIHAFSGGRLLPEKKVFVRTTTTNDFLRLQELSPSSTALFYRVLTQDDDEAAMFKVQTRAPLGYDMKEALKQPSTATGLNLKLIQALLLNQGLIFGLASLIAAALLVSQYGFSAFMDLDEFLRWSGEGPHIWNLFPSPERLVWGFGGAIPLLAVSTLIENSDQRPFHNVNFSTIQMCMTLFGRRSQPPPAFVPEQLKGSTFPTTKTADALIQSCVLASVTGTCEETVFRRYIPSFLLKYFGGNLPLAYLGQAALFGLGHAQPGVPLAENAIVVGLQFFNGLGFGLIYILSGGDILPCIIAHAVYDFVTFFKTWVDANNQIEYAETMSLQPLPTNMDLEVQRALKSTPAKIDPKVFNTIKRLFFTFDFDKNKTLSLSEVRKGLSYMAIERGAGQPPPQAAIDRLFAYAIESRDPSTAAAGRSDRLGFGDFMRLYAAMTKSAVTT